MLVGYVLDWHSQHAGWSISTSALIIYAHLAQAQPSFPDLESCRHGGISLLRIPTDQLPVLVHHPDQWRIHKVSAGGIASA